MFFRSHDWVGACQLTEAGHRPRVTEERVLSLFVVDKADKVLRTCAMRPPKKLLPHLEDARRRTDDPR